MTYYLILTKGQTQPDETPPEQYNTLFPHSHLVTLITNISDVEYYKKDHLRNVPHHVVTLSESEYNERITPPDQTRILAEYSTATDFPAMTEDQQVSFFAKPSDFANNKRTVMKTGRYLERLRKLGQLPGEEWELYKIQMQLGMDVGEVKIQYARTKEEIRHVYNNGPSSCMSGERRLFNKGKPSEMHPVDMYAIIGFPVAYVEMGGKIIARTLVNPRDKTFIRIYGANELLEPLLTEAGYTYDMLFWVGVEFPAISIPNNTGKYLMPYLDGPFRYIEINLEKRKFLIKAENLCTNTREEGFLSFS